MLGHSLTAKIVPKNGFKSVFRQVSQPDKGLVTIYCVVFLKISHSRQQFASLNLAHVEK
jgi:hypothetical protein